MKTYTALSDIPADFPPSAVTVGKFDGVHIGHRRMIDQLRAAALERSLVSAVLTFDRNPLSVFAPEVCPPSLVSNDQKLEILEQLGVEVAVMMTFDRELREQSATDFVVSALVEALRARVVLVGPDFRFGLGGKGNVALLKELGPAHGFEVPDFSRVASGGRRVSSTWVRELLSAGQVREASQLLGRAPRVRGTVVPGAHRGRSLGYPTANLSRDVEGLAPADGVYAAWALVGGVRYPAAVSVGNNPTFEGVAEGQVEAHLLGTGFEPIDLDLYEASLEVQFVERIRGMLAFPDAAALTAEMANDVQRACAVLRGHNETDR